MHGNEPPSKEVLLHFIDYLLNNQMNDENVDYILKNTRIHILPLMNPDGQERAIPGICNDEANLGRNNAKDVDLNRNFPDIFECNEVNLEPETEAIIRWLDRNDFILSANFHSGAGVIKSVLISLIYEYNCIYFINYYRWLIIHL
jgi:murein tripeptide amidase MpaA